GGAPAGHPLPLRAAALWPQASLGLSVRCPAAGAADRHAPLLPQPRAHPALRCLAGSRHRHPGRHARLPARDLGRSAGDRHLPCRWHGDGSLQALDGFLGLSRGLAVAPRRRAAVHRLHVCRDRLLHRPLLAAVRFSLRPASAVACARAHQRRHLPQFLCPSLRLGPAPRAVCADRGPVCTHVDHFQGVAGLVAGGALVWWFAAFALVALFIWFAENIGTFTAAWMYPHQRQGWTLVASGKLGAWFLLMIISYALVAMLNGLRRPPPGPCPQASPPAIAVSSRPS